MKAKTQRHSFSREESGHPNGYNHWKWKVSVRLANGNIETVYSNYLGLVLLKELRAGATLLKNFGKIFKRAAGTAESLSQEAKRRGQAYLQAPANPLSPSTV